MRLDRQLQKEILHHLAEDYEGAFSFSVQDLEDFFGSEVTTQLLYLHGHKLISGEETLIPFPGTVGVFRGYRSIDNVRITEKGLDFIQQDGGLSAILEKVTFKLDDEQFSDILELAVEQSSIPVEQKPALTRALKSAGHSTITTLFSKGIDSLASNSPEILNLIAKAI